MNYEKKDIFQYDENGKEHGYWEIYHYDGDLTYKGAFHHGRKVGLWVEDRLSHKGLTTVYYIK